jgi:exodeoxyribonuclease-3
LKIATWNVNGIRARYAQLAEWVATERPDIICLQEIKATLDQVPVMLCGLEGYWCYWHGGKGYSGVGLHVAKSFSPEGPAFQHPPFDYENRIVTVQLPSVTVASVYVPNGGKDFEAKMRFLAALEQFAADHAAAGTPLVICGDLNIARTDMDVHPKERKPRAIGQLPEERAQLERIIAHGLVDVGRALDPENDQMFTWWAPWRNMRQRNIGWRLRYQRPRPGDRGIRTVGGFFRPGGSVAGSKDPAYCTVKFTVTVMMTAVGTPLSKVGVNLHWRTASRAA